jgi:penicillin-binding protein 1A
VPVELEAAVVHEVRTLPALLVTLVLVFVGVDLGGSLYLREAMGVRLFEQYLGGLRPPAQSVVTDASGRRLGRLAAPEAVREPIDEVPPVFADALIRWEDARFHAHDGVDRIRVLGAFAALLQGDPQGGSTLTMQLAKLIKNDAARTMRRKLEDIALALELDRRLGKDEVVRVYANTAYFGSGVYGLGEACRYYFARPRCAGLQLEEAAYLVALLRAPAELSRDATRAFHRRNAVIEQMREPLPADPEAPAVTRIARAVFLRLHALWDHRLVGRSDLAGRYGWDELDAAKQKPLNLLRVRSSPSHPFVLETARQELERKLGPAIYQQGLEIRLTVDADVQQAAEAALSTGLDRLRELQREAAKAGPGAAGTPELPDDLDGGLVVIDPRTGNLLAYVPGADFRTSQVPFAARPIQVGSSLKPFVYAEYYEQGRGDLATTMTDAPVCISGWCPKNYDGRYRGPVTLERALFSSLNTVAVRVAQQVGVDAITARLRLLGVQSPLTANLPMALGASELTLLELAGLYASLYEGRVVAPRLVQHVRDPGGEILDGGAEPRRPLAYKPATLAMLHQTLAGVLGPGGTAASLGRDLEAWFGVPAGARLGDAPGIAPQIACKTGTHDGFTRAGIGCLVSDTDVGPVAVVSYVGHRTPRPLGEGLSGGRIVAPIVGALVKSLTVQTRSAGVFRSFPSARSEPMLLDETALLEDPVLGDEATEAASDEASEAASKAASKAASDAPAPSEPAPDEAVAPPPAIPEPIRLALEDRAADDAGDAPFTLARAAMAGPEELRLLAGVGEDEAGSAEEAPERALAPRDWSGLQVLDTGVIEASGPDIVSSFLDAGGTEVQLAELAPLLELSLERRVVHRQRLLAPGFTERPLFERAVTIGTKLATSFARMLDDRGSAVWREQWDPQTSALVEMDGDRRVERIYRFPRPLRLLRASYHASTGKLLALETVEGDDDRKVLVRRGDRMVSLQSRRLVVDRGALEPSWLAAGLAPAQLDGLRALLGGDLDIDRIPRGFTMDLLLADGLLLRAEAGLPAARTRDAKVSAVRTEGACVTEDGMPCARRSLPLPLAEARAYSHRGAAQTGTVVIQRGRSGAVVGAPVGGRVAFVVEERGLVAVEAAEGRMLVLEGLVPAVESDRELRQGEPIGQLDGRGVLVMRALGVTNEGRVDQVDVFDALPRLEQGDETLRAVARWWTELHAWLRGERPVVRGQLAAGPS